MHGPLPSRRRPDRYIVCRDRSRQNTQVMSAYLQSLFVISTLTSLHFSLSVNSVLLVIPCGLLALVLSLRARYNRMRVFKGASRTNRVFLSFLWLFLYPVFILQELYKGLIQAPPAMVYVDRPNSSRTVLFYPLCAAHEKETSPKKVAILHPYNTLLFLLTSSFFFSAPIYSLVGKISIIQSILQEKSFFT